MDIREDTLKLAHELEFGDSAEKLAAIMTENEWKEYQKEHPKADPKKHTIVKDEGEKSKLKGEKKEDKPEKKEEESKEKKEPKEKEKAKGKQVGIKDPEWKKMEWDRIDIGEHVEGSREPQYYTLAQMISVPAVAERLNLDEITGPEELGAKLKKVTEALYEEDEDFDLEKARRKVKPSDEVATKLYGFHSGKKERAQKHWEDATPESIHELSDKDFQEVWKLIDDEEIEVEIDGEKWTFKAGDVASLATAAGGSGSFESIIGEGIDRLTGDVPEGWEEDEYVYESLGHLDVPDEADLREVAALLAKKKSGGKSKKEEKKASLGIRTARLARDNPELRDDLLPILRKHVRKLAIREVRVVVKELPDALQKALKAIGYGRRDVGVETATKFRPNEGMAGFEGSKGFVCVVDLKSGRFKIHEGDWGGGGSRQVDVDDRPQSIPTNGAVIIGERGGRGTFAHIKVSPANFQAILPRPAGEIEKDERKALEIIRSYKTSYRKEEFEYLKLGPYGPDNPLIKSLADKGFVKIDSRGGIQITTDGKNALLAGRT